VLDRAVRNLEGLLEYQLQSRRLHASRLVLVGFGYGGTLALRLLIRGWSCAGVLTFSGQLGRPRPRILRINCKVRLIDCVTDTQTDHNGLRDDVASLSARGIDARGVALSSAALALLAAMTVATGRVLGLGLDIRWLQLVIGVFLLLFGVRWLAKALARGAGLKPLHDEEQEFAATRGELARGDWMAGWLIAFK